MISNAKYGWCTFQIDEFIGSPSYLTDVPVELLDAFIDYYERGYGCAEFDEEGSDFTFLITAYNLNIFVISRREELKLYDFSMTKDIDKLAEELIEDIEFHMYDWINFSVTDDSEELKIRRDILREKIVKLKKLKEG